jgi:dCMP deaminase
VEAKWIARFTDLTKEIASWSKDLGTKVGSVIVRPDRTICSVGFNGFPRGIEDNPYAIANRDAKLFRTIHAELNAILSAKEPLNGYSIFVWPFQPCSQCAAAIIQSGIKDVYCPFNDHLNNERWSDSFMSALQMLDEANVRVIYS